MTTLELARAIADAVFYALHPSGMGPNRSDDNVQDPPTQAVLRTLHEHGSWLCRIDLDERGCTRETPYEPIQQGLFVGGQGKGHR